MGFLQGSIDSDKMRGDSIKEAVFLIVDLAMLRFFQAYNELLSVQPRDAQPSILTTASVQETSGLLLQWQSCLFYHFSQYKAGVHASDTFELGQLAQQELFVVLHIPDNDLEEKVRRLPCNNQALENFWHVGYGSFKGFESIWRVAIHGDTYHRRQIKSKRLRFEQSDMTVDQAAFLQPFNSA